MVKKIMQYDSKFGQLKMKTKKIISNRNGYWRRANRTSGMERIKKEIIWKQIKVKLNIISKIIEK